MKIRKEIQKHNFPCFLLDSQLPASYVKIQISSQNSMQTQLKYVNLDIERRKYLQWKLLRKTVFKLFAFPQHPPPRVQSLSRISFNFRSDRIENLCSWDVTYSNSYLTNDSRRLTHSFIIYLLAREKDLIKLDFAKH